MILHNYYFSSASFRVRIALNLKGVACTYRNHHLRKGEHLEAEYLALNPQGLVPALELDDGTVLTQSLAIIEYLDEVFPEPPLLPASAVERARVRSLAAMVACDIHPVNNLRVLKFLETALGQGEDSRMAWYRHWIAAGFAPLEERLARSPATGRFCHGDRPGLADVCLVPQVVNAQRFACDLAPYPTIRRIFDECMAVDAFFAAAPQNQPEAREPQ